MDVLDDGSGSGVLSLHLMSLNKEIPEELMASGPNRDLSKEQAEVLESLNSMRNTFEAFPSISFDPPPPWFPLESQERVNKAIRTLKVALREVLPDRAEARRILREAGKS